MKAERALAHSIGRDDLQGLTLDEAIPAVNLRMSDNEVRAKAAANHPLIQRASLQSEEKRVDDTIAGQRYASDFSLSFSVYPRYPASDPYNPIDMTFSQSFSQLFADGWSPDFKLSANLTIHLFDGGQAALSHAEEESAARMAETNLQSQRQAIQDQVEADIASRDNLEEKVSLLTDSVALAQERLNNETGLLSLGKSTQLTVDAKQADFEAKQNDLWRAQADLLLTVLDLASLTGQDLAALVQGNAP